MTSAATWTAEPGDRSSAPARSACPQAADRAGAPTVVPRRRAVEPLPNEAGIGSDTRSCPATTSYAVTVLATGAGGG